MTFEPSPEEAAHLDGPIKNLTHALLIMEMLERIRAHRLLINAAQAEKFNLLLEQAEGLMEGLMRDAHLSLVGAMFRSGLFAADGQPGNFTGGT